MVPTCFWILRIPFKWFEFGFECSNRFQIVRIWIRMLWNPFDWFEFALECVKSLSSGSNLHANASNPFWVVRICPRILQIPFEWSEWFAFEWFESLWIPFDRLELTFECFESRSKGMNLDSNALSLVWMVIQMLQISFEYFEFVFECFESLSNVSILHSNA